MRLRENLGAMPAKEKEVENKRDIEQDHLDFIEAIQNTEIKVLDTAFDDKSVEHLAVEIDRAKLFLLGETHGVMENAAIIYTLFKKFGFKNLALEWDPAWRTAAERFLNGETLDFESIQGSPDGRITAGHFALLKKLKDEGLLEKLICFDSSTNADWNARDKGMAQHILENFNDLPTLVVAGRLHTLTESFTLEDESESHPMGELLKQTVPNLPTGKIEYLSGAFHNYGTQQFDETTEDPESQIAQFFKHEDGLYIFELPKAQAATVPNPHEI